MRRLAILSVIVIAGIAIALTGGWFGEQPEPVTLSSVTASAVPNQPGAAHVYLTIENGAQPNRLVSVSSPEAAEARFAGMAMAEPLGLPAGGKPSLSADGVFIELSGIEGELVEGRLIPISLKLDPAGDVTAMARVGKPLDPHAGHAMMAMGDMAKEPLQGAGNMPPALELSANVVDGGIVVDLKTSNFTFDPDSATPVHVPGHGHGHLYLNGLKLQRVYSTHTEIGALPPGSYTLTISLNTNVHQAYMDENGPVAASAKITID
ncbi:copper chaperone PCu(A)C [Hoeflea sp.]|uniref:copper chaperone PCu(A)C n=1 Tax=Hoeflea sp. TaxID=1940281 RepID=UPI00374A261B